METQTAVQPTAAQPGADILPATTDGAMPAAAYVASLRPGPSQASARGDLAKIARIMGADDWRAVDWRTLNAANVAAIMAKIEGAPATRRRTLSTLRGIARAAWRMGALDSETLARIADIKGDTGTRELAGRQIEDWEIAQLVRTCAADATPAGARDAALIALAWATGARRDELAGIMRETLTRTPDGFEARIVGKRNRARTLYITNGAARALADWLAVRGDEPGAVFCAIDKAGRIAPAHRITTTAAHLILRKRAAQAGIGDIGWHDFRRTFAGGLLDAGEDIATVAALMGHASVNTTARYDRRPAEARRRAARKVSTPYFGRQAAHDEH